MEDELIGAAELHAGKRRWLLVVGGNLLLLLVMLGIPWLRGYLRTRALWRAFGAYGACLYGARPAPEPGLGMPSGHEARFATRALREPGWSAACDDELAALAPEEAIFLMPGVKVAESDLRAAVALVRNELAPLPVRPPGARLSTRPVRAIERLRAGLANHALAAGAVEVPEENAFVWEGEAEVLPTPTRLPLYAGVNARISLWGSDVELHALATDHTGVSYVHVRAGKLEQTRTPRPKLLEAAIPSALPSAFVWAMPRARCAERARGCADKTLGLASVSLPVNELPAPRWLGAHPSGRVDRSVLQLEQQVTVAAEAAEGASEVREFRFDHEAEASASAETPPLPASRVWGGSGRGEPLVLAGGQYPAVLLAAHAEASAQLLELTPEDARTLAELPGEGAPWVVGCGGGPLQLAFGHEHALLAVERAASGALTTWEPVPVELARVIDDQNPARDRVVPVCGVPGRAVSVVHDQRGRLLLVSCRTGESRCAVEVIAHGVRSFAALAWEERLIAAYAGDGEFSQLRVRSVRFAEPALADEQVPAVCWSDGRGLCGAPLLARVGGRALLGTREGTDLRVLESHDAGLSWRPLKGLGKRD